MRPLSAESRAPRGESAAASSRPTIREPLLAHLEEVLESKTFAGARRQQQLLRFLVTRFVEGRTNELKEYSVGVEVFGRGDDFDPRLDPIVRVEASRLRGRLQKYYETAGAASQYRIVLPRGGYVPAILDPSMSGEAKAAVAETADAPQPASPFAAEPVAGGQVAPPAPRSRNPEARSRPLLWIVVLAGALIAVLAAFSLVRRTPAREPSYSSFTRITPENGRSTSPTLTPDGLQLVHAHRNRGDWDLYLRRPGTDSKINLTQGSPADDYQPAYSPDGRQIAFRSEREGGGIFLMPAGGGAARRVSSFGYNPSWSPDGERIVFSTGTFTEPEEGPARRAALHVLHLATQTITPLTTADTVYDAVQPVWSPHGQRIAFWGAGPDSNRDIWTVAAGGKPSDSRPAPATRDASIDWSPAWSADGRYLYFSSDRGGPMNLWRVRIDESSGAVTGSPEPVTTPSSYSGWSAFSRDGRRMAYSRRIVSSNLYKARLEPGGRKPASAPEQLTTGLHRLREPSISPDGAWLAIRVQDPQEDIALIRTDGTGLRRLTNDPFRDQTPRWSPDGSYILFRSNRGGDFELWAVRPGSGELRPMTRGGATSALWWPDGILVGRPRGRPAFAIHPPNRAVPNTDLPADFEPLAWSPDGKLIAGIRQSPGTPGGLAVYSPSNRQTWVADTGGGAPVWLSDSRHLLFSLGNQVRLADVQARRTFTVLAPDNRLLHRRFAVSPDGRELFLTMMEDEEDIWLGVSR